MNSVVGVKSGVVGCHVKKANSGEKVLFSKKNRLNLNKVKFETTERQIIMRLVECSQVTIHLVG